MLDRRGAAIGSPSGRLFKHLNGGCVFARPSAYAALVQHYLDYTASLDPARAAASNGTGTPLGTHEARSLYKQQTPTIYHTNDQAALQRMMLSPAYGGRFDLDYETAVCLNVFSSTPKLNLEWRDHLLVSRLTEAPPGLVHYNGRCGERGAYATWMHGYHAHTLDCHVQVRRGANWTEKRFAARFRELIRFVDARFVERAGVEYRELCGAFAGPTAAMRKGCVE